MKYTILSALAVMFTFASCQKYAEGPNISLRSKTERVANTWQIQEATEDGQDVTSHYDEYELQLLNDGDARLAALYSFGDLYYEYETNGTWDFQNNNEELELDMQDDDADRKYVILRLAEDELWLREKGGDLELKLMPK